jgi:hypothetical protein
MDARNRGGTYWLITWEGVDPILPKGSNEHVAAIVSAHRSTDYISKFIQDLHGTKCLSLAEQSEQSRYRNPVIAYPAEQHRNRITCGHNPFLVARKVRRLTVEIDDLGDEIANWDEFPQPNLPVI